MSRQPGPVIGRHALSALTMLACALSAESARAASCVVSAVGISFGIYDAAAGSHTDSSGSVSIACHAVLGPQVHYALHLASGSSAGAPKMRHGSATLDYQLYTDANRSEVWGDGSNGTKTVSGTFPSTLVGSSKTHPLYGRIPARQNPSAGTYSDTVTVTVVY